MAEIKTACHPGRANGSARSAARWQAPREPGSI